MTEDITIKKIDEAAKCLQLFKEWKNSK